MATRTYLIFKENDKEVLNCQIFGNNFYDNTFFNEVVKLAGMTRFMISLIWMTSWSIRLKQKNMTIPSY